MSQTITIPCIINNDDETFTASVQISVDGFGEIELDVTVKAKVYGEVPRLVNQELAKLGNAIATAALSG